MMLVIYYYKTKAEIMYIPSEDYASVYETIHDIIEDCYISKDKYIYHKKDIISEFGDDLKYQDEYGKFDFDIFDKVVDPDEINSESIAYYKTYYGNSITIHGYVDDDNVE